MFLKDGTGDLFLAITLLMMDLLLEKMYEIMLGKVLDERAVRGSKIPAFKNPWGGLIHGRGLG